MGYELYRNHRLAPDDNGCWDVLTNPEYEQVGTYPSKAAAKRAVDKIEDAPCDHHLPYVPKELEMNYGKPIMFKYICRDCSEEVIFSDKTAFIGKEK